MKIFGDGAVAAAAAVVYGCGEVLLGVSLPRQGPLCYLGAIQLNNLWPVAFMV